MNHRGQRLLSPSLSGVGVDVDGTVVSSPILDYTADAASAALRVGYTYPLAAYLYFCLGRIQYPFYNINSTAEAAEEAEVVASLASSDIGKKFRCNSD